YTKEEHHTGENIAKGIEEFALTLTVETRWMSVFECLDHILKTKIAMRALLAEENIILNQEIKNYIIDD
ncbi:16816_t:CDS:2, partial [Rhizophagus irregularis]